ncbi:MAG: hypothetical protein JSR81_10835 [Proteobacteria bacterium]|nr:hypothetical protein [Pseudomonadota bacterium]
MSFHRKALHTVALFGSFSTLFCCALPALFVALGAGAAFAGIVSTVPQLIWLSEHKIWLFGFAGTMLTLSAVSRYLTRNAPCPADPAKRKSCKRLRRISLGVFCFSLSLYMTGFYFAFLAGHLS